MHTPLAQKWPKNHAKVNCVRFGISISTNLRELTSFWTLQWKVSLTGSFHENLIFRKWTELIEMSFMAEKALANSNVTLL